MILGTGFLALTAPDGSPLGCLQYPQQALRKAQLEKNQRQGWERVPPGRKSSQDLKVGPGPPHRTGEERWRASVLSAYLRALGSQLGSSCPLPGPGLTYQGHGVAQAWTRAMHSLTRSCSCPCSNHWPSLAQCGHSNPCSRRIINDAGQSSLSSTEYKMQVVKHKTLVL